MISSSTLRMRSLDFLIALPRKRGSYSGSPNMEIMSTWSMYFWYSEKP